MTGLARGRAADAGERSDMLLTGAILGVGKSILPTDSHSGIYRKNE